jgi:hypothetical protein
LPSPGGGASIGGMSAPETLTLRATAIAGQRYPDDYAVIWRGMSVGRIMLGNGAPHARPQMDMVLPRPRPTAGPCRKAEAEEGSITGSEPK